MYVDCIHVSAHVTEIRYINVLKSVEVGYT